MRIGSTVNALSTSTSTTALNDSNQFAFQDNLANGASGVAFATITFGPSETPYEIGATNRGLTGNDALPAADSDKEGRINLEEFALDGDPKFAWWDQRRAT